MSSRRYRSGRLTPGQAASAVGVAAVLIAASHAGHAAASGAPARWHAGQGAGTALVAEAERFVGDPYVYGAAGPDAFDCSGLVWYSLRKLGISAPRTSEQQWDWVRRVGYRALRPGDLIFEQWPGDQDAPPGHVVIYAGHGQVVEAPQPGQAVHVRSWSPGETWIIGYGQVPGLS